ncbi:MAG: sodium:solute symporter family protein [Bacteroidales bacterium]|nr:sodium:solute symporter family protein [Bacteroidales bacterium]
MDFTGTKLTTLDIILLIAYALVCIGIGLWSSKNQNKDDYLIAGRKMSLWAFMASVVASYIGGAAIVAYTAYVYDFGVSAIAVFAGTSAGFLVFIPYALKLREIAAEREFYTLSDWFYYQYDNKVGLLSAIILFVVYFGMLLNQFIAGSSILANISGWSYETALMISSLVIIIYLFAGGFRSVVKTDIFQYIVLFVLFLLLGFVLLTEKRAMAADLLDLSRMSISMTIAFIAFGVFIIFQSAEYWQRVYAAKNTRVVKKGLIGSAILTVITGLAVTLIGLAAHRNVPGIMAKDAFAEGLTLLIPDAFIGAGLVLIFAAIMSSADTIIFVLASSLAKDYSAHFRKQGQSKQRLMGQTRLFIIVLSLLGFVFAWSFRDIVAVIVFITGLGFTIIPAAIASFHMKIDTRSAFASFGSGIAYILVLILTDNMIPEASVASIVVSTIVLILSQSGLLLKRKFVDEKPKSL